MKMIKKVLPAILWLFTFPGIAAIIQKDMILNILVKNDDMLTQEVKVQQDGTIDYPLYQDTPVIGMTTSELQDILTLKLANYSDAPFVLVTVLSELPISISVLGQVKRPGPVKVGPQASLQEIIEAAGGMTEFSNFSKIKIVRQGQSDEDAGYYNLQEFLNTGNLSLLPKIMDGDRVIVLSSLKTNKIKVLGAVNKPGYYVPHDSTNVFDMIYLAGGPTQDANLSKIRILGNENGRETDAVVNLRSFIDKGKLSDVPKVSPGDVVIVYRKSFTWSKTLTVVRDIVALVTAWFIISQLFK